MTRPHTHPAEILLVEDNATDVLLTREALAEAKVLTQLHVVDDGEKALRFLRREDEYSNAPRPDLILLDLNLPRRHGREVLQEIKGDPALKTIPVVVLTVSGHDEDIERAYGLHANCYVRKPVRFEEFTRVIRSIEHFWFAVVTLPEDGR